MKIREASEKANEALEGADKGLMKLSDIVISGGHTKWVILGLIVAILALAVALLWPSKARATGYEWTHVMKHMVKPPVVVPVTPPVVTPPVAASTPSATAQQPAGLSQWPGYIAIAGVAIYFSAVIRSHWIWCAEDDRKPAKERKCYRPLRDGM